MESVRARGARREEGASLRSVHHYTRAVKGFSRWLWRDGRARDDALIHLSPPNPDPDRRRKLLLHRREITELGRRTSQESLTLIPLSMYFKEGRAKVDLALARGRKLYAQVCTTCHGLNGNFVAGHELSTLRQRRDLDATIQYIKDPKPPMPKLYPALLDDQAVVDVATYVQQEIAH